MQTPLADQNGSKEQPGMVLLDHGVEVIEPNEPY
jgi:hypothetical protein